MATLLNTAILQLNKRAENADRDQLVATFVNTGVLVDSLASNNHQVLFGRRGTGKTHALSYMAQSKALQHDPTAFIDLRTIGSTGGLYADEGQSLPVRATGLLVDFLNALHEGLREYIIGEELAHEAINTLDSLAEAISQVQVVGVTTVESGTGSETDESFDARLSASLMTFELSAEMKEALQKKLTSTFKSSITGTRVERIEFGNILQHFRDIAKLIGPKRIWIYLDEWSSLPLTLQPYLADLIRRCLLPLPQVTVKIASIEDRAIFKVTRSGAPGDYIGLELGADIAADLNLDDFMVYESDPERARAFFLELLFKHVKEKAPEEVVINSPEEFRTLAFTQSSAFDEFVRSAEGVPRDAINILAIAAQRADDNKIGVEHIRSAARDWYARDKESAVSGIEEATDLLRWIIDEVIGVRRARAFLIHSKARSKTINALFDARVVHILKRNISSKDEPGERYDAYKLDYGCYVELMSTAKAPDGVLPGMNEDGEAFFEVPPDDYRSIRRAILDLEAFYSRPVKQIIT